MIFILSNIINYSLGLLGKTQAIKKMDGHETDGQSSNYYAKQGTLKSDLPCLTIQEYNIRSERKILCATRSDFMVKMHYSFQTKECLYIAMEYCPGKFFLGFLILADTFFRR